MLDFNLWTLFISMAVLCENNCQKRHNWLMLKVWKNWNELVLRKEKDKKRIKQVAYYHSTHDVILVVTMRRRYLPRFFLRWGVKNIWTGNILVNGYGSCDPIIIAVPVIFMDTNCQLKQIRYKNVSYTNLYKCCLTEVT